MEKSSNPPFACSFCGEVLKYAGHRTADPWPDEDGTLYDVEIYTCPDQNCPGSKQKTEYWPEAIH